MKVNWSDKKRRLTGKTKVCTKIINVKILEIADIGPLSWDVMKRKSC